MKDFKQIAEENHISRQTIYNRIARIPNFKNEHLSKKNGKWFVDDEGVKLLNLPHKSARPKHYKRRNGFVKQDYIDQNQALRKKLIQRDRVIANFSQAYKALANQSKQNQKLLKGQKSKPQVKLGRHYTPQFDKSEYKSIKYEREAKERKTKLDNFHKKLDNHTVLRWLYNHMD